MLRSSIDGARETGSRHGRVPWPLALISVVIVAVSLISVPPASAQVVSPLQTGHYIPAISNVRDMSHPPPGIFVLWYNAYASGNGYTDKNGNKFETIPLSELNPDLPDIDVDLKMSGFASVPSVFWVPTIRVLGGARYMAGIAPCYTYADGSVVTERAGIANPDTTITQEFSGSGSGFSDLFVIPLGLSWQLGSFDITTVYGFYAPTGKYETGGEGNLGLGFWTHQLQAFGYYYPVADKSTAIMLGLTYEINGKIKDADVTPGNRFALDWGVSQYVSEKIELLVQGGHSFQVGDDTGNDVFWDPSYHDSKSTVAFGASYWVLPNRLALTGKYAFDFGARQRFENNTFMLNVTYITGWLTGE